MPAFGISAALTKRFQRLVDDNTRMYYAFIVTARWLAVWLDMVSLLLLAVAAFGSIALESSLNAGAVGLGLSFLMQLTGLVQWLIRQVTWGWVLVVYACFAL